MFLSNKCHLIENPLSIILLALTLFNLTLIQQAVYGDDEFNSPHTQGNDEEEALNITSDSLQSQKGVVNRSNIILNNSNILKTNIDSSNAASQLDVANVDEISSRNTEQFLNNSDSVNQEFYKNIKSNNSIENWNDMVTDVEQEKDIICLYRKTSNDTKITKLEDWKQLLNIAEGFTIYSVKNDGSKYLICLKKVIPDEITTTTVIPIPDTAETISTEMRRSNNANDFDLKENCSENNGDETESSCSEDSKSTVVPLEHTTPKYTRNNFINKSSFLRPGHFFGNKENRYRNVIQDEYRRNQRQIFLRNQQRMYDQNFKTRKIIKKPQMLVLIFGIRKMYKTRQNKLTSLLKTRPKVDLKIWNSLFYSSKNSIGKKITAIPYILFNRLHPLITIRLMNLYQNLNSLSKILTKYNQQKLPCKNKYDVSLIQLKLLSLLEQFSFQFSKIFNRMSFANRCGNNLPSVEQFNTGLNLLSPYHCSKILSPPGINDLNKSIGKNIDINPLENCNIKPLMDINKFYNNDERLDNFYQAHIKNGNSIEMRMMDNNQKDSNDTTTESSIKTESTVQYLNSLNDSANVNITSDESTIAQNSATEPTQ